MLEDVTDEEFSEMLDFRKRNPEVIKKALKEAKLDPRFRLRRYTIHSTI